MEAAPLVVQRHIFGFGPALFAGAERTEVFARLGRHLRVASSDRQERAARMAHARESSRITHGPRQVGI